jgi:hypothetical protein
LLCKRRISFIHWVFLLFERRLSIMKLSPPKTITYWIAVILGLLGIVGTFVALPLIGGYEFWLLALGFVLLALANLMEGL